MEKKMTKVEMFTAIKAKVADNADMVDFLNHEIELLQKKSANKKATKTQEENELVKADIVDYLATNGAKTATEIMNGLAEKYAGISIQKVSALIRILEKEENKIARRIDGKKTVFSVA